MHFVRNGFELPEKINKALISFLWNGKNPSAADLKKRANALKRLWPLLAKDRGQAAQDKKHYALDDQLAEAYAAYYLPVNAMKSALILEEMKLAGLGLDGRVRWMDVGTGPGTAFWGAAWWAAHRETELEFIGLEQSREFIRLAQSLSRSLIQELKSTASARFESFTYGKGAKSLTQWLRQEKPHVLSMMNSVGEMAPSSEERAAWIGEAVDELSTCAQADGQTRWLILVEPGSKAASRELLQLRDALRNRSQARGDLRIWLPCLSDRPCGALAKPDDWCHDETEVRFPEWVNDLGAEAGLRKEAVLFSYLVCSVGVHPQESAEWPGRGMRVVSQLMREKGLSQCFLCTETGKVRARVLNSRMTEESAAFFETVRGHVYKNVELSEKGDVARMNDAGWPQEADATVFPPLE